MLIEISISNSHLQSGTKELNGLDKLGQLVTTELVKVFCVGVVAGSNQTLVLLSVGRR